MFSLIVVLVSLVLMGLLAFIAVYYGGSAYANAHNRAVVDQLINEGSQIKAATVLYATENSGTLPTDLSQLTTVTAQNPNAYLRSAPGGWNVASGGPSVAYTSVHGKDICNAFNARYGIQPDAAGNPPACSTVTTAEPVCCS